MLVSAISTWISHRLTDVPSLLNLPPTPSHRSRLSRSTSLSSLSHTASSHWLSSYGWWCVCFLLSRSSHPLLPALCPQVCSHVCVSTAPLHIASTVTSFWIPYIRASTRYVLLSFWLHCIPVYFLCVCLSEILLTVE